MKRRCASGRETLCTRSTYRITKAYIKNIKTTINMNIMTSNTIRITTRNHDRALKVLRHCVTIKKKMLSRGWPQWAPRQRVTTAKLRLAMLEITCACMLPLQGWFRGIEWSPTRLQCCVRSSRICASPSLVPAQCNRIACSQGLALPRQAIGGSQRWSGCTCDWEH